ncbi:hypothetical protein C0Q70_13507 [Pomacea canaliculata]|uniref:Uncharacterized protein n=1 Tax=Pomacea canaliculata TaxID=400727 RepID=A0A2T7NXG0_POMCA|nr:hypothetical protein C0Q70_13507 [Pomacea canaliculata]
MSSDKWSVTRDYTGKWLRADCIHRNESRVYWRDCRGGDEEEKDAEPIWFPNKTLGVGDAGLHSPWQRGPCGEFPALDQVVSMATNNSPQHEKD